MSFKRWLRGHRVTAAILAGTAFLLITLPGWVANWLAVTSDQRVQGWWSSVPHFFVHLWWLPTAVGGAVLLLILWALFNPSRQEKAAPESVEQKVGQWLDASLWLHRTRKDNKQHFGFVVSIPPRFFVTIGHQKDCPSYLTLISKIGLLDQQRVLFEKMSQGEKVSAHRTLRLECSKAKIHFHTDNDFKCICVHHKQMPLAELNETRFRDSISDAYFAANVVMDTLNSIMPPPVE
jgi:hypothetical protein